MTDTTDTAALLEKLKAQTNSYDTVIIRDFEAKQLVAAFEAERQRADKNGKMLERVSRQRDKAFTDIEKAEAWVDALETRLQYTEAELVASNDLRIVAEAELAELRGAK